jgi:hypothetical protein
VVAVGDRIKLPPDAIAAAGAPALEPQPYDSPEARAGGALTPATDMWALGAMLVEILTRQRPVSGGSVPYLPEPFATIVNRTLRDNAAERWSAAEIKAWLNPPAPAMPVPIRIAVPEPAPPPAAAASGAAAAAPAAALEPAEPLAGRHAASGRPAYFEGSATRSDGVTGEDAPEAVTPRELEPARVRHGGSMKWVPLAGVLAAGLGLIFLPHSRPPAGTPAAKAPAAPVVEPAAPRAAPPAASESPAPAPPSAERSAPAPNANAVWRVVVYEYNRRAAAERRASTLNRQRPGWHAQVFTPKGDRAPYLVALGGPMTRAEAERLRQQARAAGLPRDTFIRNYPR